MYSSAHVPPALHASANLLQETSFYFKSKYSVKVRKTTLAN